MHLWRVTIAIAVLATITIIVIMLIKSDLDATVLGMALGIALREIGNLIQGVFGGNNNKDG